MMKLVTLMPQTNEQYWAARKKSEQDWIKQNLADDKSFNKQLQKSYNRALAEIQKEIDAEYGRYAANQELTKKAARRAVSAEDVKAFATEAKRIVAEAHDLYKTKGSPLTFKDFSQATNDRLMLYNATMRINRLEMLKSKVGLQLTDAGLKIDSTLANKLQQDYQDEIKRQAGILGETVSHKFDRDVLQTIMAQHNGYNYSERIWINQDQLKSKLDDLLTRMMLKGENPRVIARDLRDQVREAVDNQRYVTERIARTESARVQNQAQLDSFNGYGFDYCKWVAEPSACSICAAIASNDDGVYPVKDVPAIPAHPNCRCSIAAYVPTIGEKGYSGLNRIGTNAVNLDYINSDTFRKKFTRMTPNTKVNDKLRNYATALLTKYHGTDTEGLYAIDDRNGQLLFEANGEKNAIGVELDEKQKQILIANRNNLIALHNHPTNLLPTGSDYSAAGYRKYQFGLVVTHDGRVFKYSAGTRPILAMAFDKRVAKYSSSPYNYGIEEAFKKATHDFMKEVGFKCEEL